MASCAVCRGVLHRANAHEVPCQKCGVIAFFDRVGKNGEKPAYVCEDDELHARVLALWELTAVQRESLKRELTIRRMESLKRVRKEHR